MGDNGHKPCILISDRGKPMPSKNDWIKTAGSVLGVLAVILTLIATLLIAPVKECATEAKGMAKDNSGKIMELDKRVGRVEDQMDNVDKNIIRLMRANGVPPVEEVPSGYYPYDNPTTEAAK